MKSDIVSLLPKDTKSLKVVANIPYYITTPLVTKLLSCGVSFESLVLLVQKEVAVRMAAPPGSKDCGAISCFVSWRAEPKIMLEVPPEAFYPAPKVSIYAANSTAPVWTGTLTPNGSALPVKLLPGTYTVKEVIDEVEGYGFTSVLYVNGAAWNG